MSFVTSLLTNAPTRRTVRRAALYRSSPFPMVTLVAIGVARAQSAQPVHPMATSPPWGAGNESCAC